MFFSTLQLDWNIHESQHCGWFDWTAFWVTWVLAQCLRHCRCSGHICGNNKRVDEWMSERQTSCWLLQDLHPAYFILLRTWTLHLRWCCLSTLHSSEHLELPALQQQTIACFKSRTIQEDSSRGRIQVQRATPSPTPPTFIHLTRLQGRGRGPAGPDRARALPQLPSHSAAASVVNYALPTPPLPPQISPCPQI